MLIITRCSGLVSARGFVYITLVLYFTTLPVFTGVNCMELYRDDAELKVLSSDLLFHYNAKASLL